MSDLTKQTKVPFELCFRYQLIDGYTFMDLSKADLKQFQGFLNKVAKMTVDQVDKKFKRPSDKNDKYKGKEVSHYKVDEKFRIHVVVEDGHIRVIRLDPNHKFHP